MNRRPLTALALITVLTGMCGGFAQSAPQISDLMPADIEWKDSALPGVQTAVISGDPTQAGLYVIRAKLGAGAQVMPHTHPDTRYDTVLSGQIHFGFGDAFDTGNAKLYPAGTQIAVPANAPHFAWVDDGDAVLQEVGIGPSGHVPVKK